MKARRNLGHLLREEMLRDVLAVVLVVVVVMTFPDASEVNWIYVKLMIRNNGIGGDYLTHVTISIHVQLKTRIWINRSESELLLSLFVYFSACLYIK